MSQRVSLSYGDKFHNFEYCGPPVKTSSKSVQKLLFKCACGNIKGIYVNSVANGQKTCGDCNKIWLRFNEKYKNFTYVGKDRLIGPNSPQKVPFKCECGKIKSIRVNNVSEGMKNCNKCNEIELHPDDRIGNFSYAGTSPVQVQPGSSKKLSFRCKCGRVTDQRIGSVISGRNKTCGCCNNFILNPGDDFHGFKYVGDSIDVGPGSHKVLRLRCRCGNLCSHKVWEVTYEYVTGCGKCNVIPFRSGDRFGNFVYVGQDAEFTKWNKEKRLFRCRCGNEKMMTPAYIASGNSTTCGSCRGPVEEWYRVNASKLASLKFPIRKEDIPCGGPTFLEDVKNGHTPIRVKCPVCRSEYKPRFYGIRRGISLTCGCVYNRISKANRDIASFVQSLGFETELEFRLEKFSYDVHPIGSCILIEYHGRTWHNSDYTDDLDRRKRECAERNGYRLITILEMDWKEKQADILDVLCHVLGVKNGLSATD